MARANDTCYVYQLRLTHGGKYYVGCTTDTERRLEDHNKRPGPWVRRWGPPVEMLVLDTTSREHAQGAEDKAVAVLMWAVGANAVRGGTRVESQEYTRDEASRLARFIAGYMGLDNARVFDRLMKELPPDVVCSKCSRVTFAGRPLCRDCYVKDCTCLFCGRKGHLCRECPLAPQAEAGVHPQAADEIADLLQELFLEDQAPLPDGDDEVRDAAEVVVNEPAAIIACGTDERPGSPVLPLSQPMAERRQAPANVCRMCPQVLSASYFSVCSVCFRAVNACYDCGESGHLRGEAGCAKMSPLKQLPSGEPKLAHASAAAAAMPESAAPRGAAAELAAPRSGKKRYRTEYPRFSHLGCGFCWTCGFPGHCADKCESERDKDGDLLPRLLDYQIDVRVGPGPDTAAEPAAAPPQPLTSWDADIVLPYQCIRCGLGGHRRAECVEEVHKEGWALSPRPPSPI